MPLPSTRMIDPRWSAHHQPAVETSFNARVAIVDPNRTVPGVWDEETLSYGPPTPWYVAGGPGEARPEWAGGVPCRIQRQRDDRALEQAGQNSTVRLYLIQFPADLPDVEVGYVATVTDALNDPHLVGEDLVAADVMHGSERFNRDIAWVHNQQPPDTSGG